MLEGDGLLRTAAAESGAAPGFERRRDVGGRTPTVAVGTGFKAWEKFLHFEKKGPLGGGCRGETEGLRPAPPPGGCSCFFHLCHQVSAAEPRRIRETRGADTRTHTGLQLAASWGLLGLADPTDPTAISPPSGTPREDLGGGHLQLGLSTLFLAGLPAIPYSVLAGALILNLASWISSAVVVTSGCSCLLWRRFDCPFVFSA